MFRQKLNTTVVSYLFPLLTSKMSLFVAFDPAVFEKKCQKHGVLKKAETAVVVRSVDRYLGRWLESVING